MSRRSGTLRKMLSPSESSAAHSSGNAAFLEPLTGTVPISGLPPTIWMLSTPPGVARRRASTKLVSGQRHAQHEQPESDGDQGAPAQGFALDEAVLVVD